MGVGTHIPGPMNSGSDICWVQGTFPSRVRSEVNLERTCDAKTLGHEILVHLVERMEERREENRARTWKAMVPN